MASTPKISTRRRLRAALCVAALLALALPAIAQAEALSNAGKEFWLGFTSNLGTAQQTLYISGTSATTGTVSVPGLGFSEAFSVTPGTVTAVRLPAGAEMNPYDSGVTEDKGVHVVAEKPVTVYGLNDEDFTTDAFTGLPTDVVGDAYTVLAFGSGLGGNSEFSVVATEDHTKVTITPSVTAGAIGEDPAGTPFEVDLEAGEEYQLQATVNPEDLTGTKIASNNPVSVFGGQQCANVPTNEFVACDTLTEQNYPESTWGTSFLTEPLKTRSHGDYFELAADQSGTEVSLNGAHLVTLNEGEHYGQEIEGASEITSSKPIELAQYSNSSSYDETTGDPFMINIPPYQQFETGYTITTPVGSTTVFGNYVNLVVPDAEVGAVKLDGTAIASSEYSPIGTSGFEGVQVEIAEGSHVLSGNGQPFGAFVYGFSEYNGYGYAGGFSLAPVAEVTKVTLTPAEETAVVNTSHCVTAAVTDQNGEPVPGVRVDFVVTGANSATGSVFAEEDGKAQFCYTGTNTGLDTITGSVGAISGTAHKSWEAEAVTKEPTSLTTSLSGEGRSGSSITVDEGASVTDKATLTGAHASSASGTVTYDVYSDAECTDMVGSSEVSVSGGVVPASAAQVLSTPGTYYWTASYGGDAANEPSSSSCGAETVTVEKMQPPPPECTSAVGEARFGTTAEREGVKNDLNTNLSDPQTFVFSWGRGKDRVTLVKLNSAKCAISAKTGTASFKGSGEAKLNGSHGDHKLTFTIRLRSNGTLKVSVTVRDGKSVITHQVGVARSTEVIH